MADVRFTAFVQGVNPQTGHGKDPRFETLNNGKNVLNFNSAEPHSKPNQQGGYDKTGTTYRRVTCWDALAVQHQNIQPGTRVEIIGYEQTREFQNSQTGEKGRSFEVTATALLVLPSKNQQGGGGNQQGNQGGRVPNQNPAQPYGQGAPQGQAMNSDPWGGGQQQSYDWGQSDDQPPF